MIQSEWQFTERHFLKGLKLAHSFAFVIVPINMIPNQVMIKTPNSLDQCCTLYLLLRKNGYTFCYLLLIVFCY